MYLKKILPEQYHALAKKRLFSTGQEKSCFNLLVGNDPSFLLCFHLACMYRKKSTYSNYTLFPLKG